MKASFRHQNGILIFFPDPWSKKASQAHNKLIDQKLCFTLHRLLSAHGFIWFKTDDKSYYDLVCHYMQHAGMQTCKNRCKISSREYKSIFEQRFQKQGQETYEIVWRKQADV